MPAIERIYLDYNATTPLCAEAFDVALPFLQEQYANPSSSHFLGEQVRAAFEEARSDLAGHLGLRPAELYFTSGATESINWAIRGRLGAQPNKRRIVTTAVEHSATLDVCAGVAKEGVVVDVQGVDGDGALDMDALAATLGQDVALLSIMWTNNETGVEFDIPAIAALARDKGVCLHVDAAQKIGKGLPSLHDLPIDLLSFSGHKFGAMKGCGGLVIRRGVGLRPLIWGGHHEGKRRGGTENVPGVLTMAAALRQAVATWEQKGAAIRASRDALEQEILAAIPEVLVNGNPQHRNENTLNIALRGIEGQGVVITLAQQGIYCSSGSACTSADVGPSHVLVAMGLPLDYVHGALRFSLGAALNAETRRHVVDKLVLVVEKLRRMTR